MSPERHAQPYNHFTENRMTEEKTRYHRYGCFFKLCVIAVILFVVLLIAVVSDGWRNRRAVKKTVAMLKRKGVRVSPEEIIPECPDGEKALLLYQRADDMFVFRKMAENDLWEMVSKRDWSSLTTLEKNLPQADRSVEAPLLGIEGCLRIHG